MKQETLRVTSRILTPSRRGEKSKQTVVWRQNSPAVSLLRVKMSQRKKAPPQSNHAGNPERSLLLD